ncbi:peptidoglycan editing factor PgeF [Halalkalibacter krulwichiae]|uniref:Purine nucleoside phosphorylase n=1 Tax=Halalkalibacter krulwichiae TaxID=199441 RepID=A0A1X9MEX4_9BACI|nr:peptidoglycan editing factor PgeF [Halalkalibacter krulwichiae]ARK31080.1 Laccase domain protein [Halalkalibacter krulwichiae]
MEAFVQVNNRYVTIQPWSESRPQLVVGFTTRDGGTSKSPFSSLNMGFHVGDEWESVLQNRQLVANDLNISLENWIGTEQVHEADIQKVTMEDAGKGSRSLKTAIAHTDGIYTNEKDLLLTSLYADCVPLYFYSPSHEVVGLAHAGWRGTVKNIGAKMVQVFKTQENIRVEDIHVAIGPCISKQAYEVDQKVIDEVTKSLPVDNGNLPYETIGNNKYLLDLREINKNQLIEVGILPDHIINSSICTTLDTRMFSHRAENGKTGRMMSFIGIKSVVK